MMQRRSFTRRADMTHMDERIRTTLDLLELVIVLPIHVSHESWRYPVNNLRSQYPVQTP